MAAADALAGRAAAGRTGEQAAARGAAAAGDVRADFLQVIADLDGDDAALLSQQIRSARSPRELWHLRSAVFGLLAVQRSQSEATQRVAALNRHFPTRAPRSGFGTIEG